MIDWILMEVGDIDWYLLQLKILILILILII